MIPEVAARRSLTALAVASACVFVYAARPDPVTPYPPDWPHRAPWKLTRELLLPETQRIVFVVDTPRGQAPRAEGLDHLVTLASKYGGRPASWVRLGDQDAPRVTWVEPSVPPKLEKVVRLRVWQALSDLQLTRDDIDTIRYVVEVPSCPPGGLPKDTSYVFVRYVGYLGGSYGHADVVVSDASCGGREFPVLRIAQSEIALDRPPVIGQAFLEQRALAHEYGHILGLASNPAHGRWLSTVPYRGGEHCIHRECAVHVPTAKALLKGQMLDYCAACVHDIEEAREHWRSGREFAEVPRLPQPDAAAHVARLKKYNFREGGEADKLFGYGKAVMPALLERLPSLPDGSAASPRSYAVRLALAIVLSEDAARRPPGTPDPVLPDAAGDVSAALLSWWSAESEQFLGGDDWTLPPMLRTPRAEVK